MAKPTWRYLSARERAMLDAMWSMVSDIRVTHDACGPYSDYVTDQYLTVREWNTMHRYLDGGFAPNYPVPAPIHRFAALGLD